MSSLNTEKKKVIVDCDTGVDDAVALLLCLKKLDVVGITAVCGNVGLPFTQRNTRYVTEVAGRTDVPVYAGYDRPMFVPLKDAAYVHGSGGFGPVEVPEPKKQLEKQHAVDFIIETFMTRDDVSLITLAPLTNIAHAILREPMLKKRIPEILCMGGSTIYGNVTAAAEFNIHADPEAAKIVFESGIPIKMVGLNATRQQTLTKDLINRMQAIDNDAARLAVKLGTHVLNRGRYASFCDACAVMWYVDDQVITKSVKMHVAVETKGEFTRGMTLCDIRPFVGCRQEVDIEREWMAEPLTRSEEPNVDVAMELDQKRFDKVLLETLESYSEV